MLTKHMNTVIKLRADDFEIQAGTKGPILCTSIKGIALVLFWAQCDTCDELEQRFRHLPQIINGCKFCTINIKHNQGVIAMSNKTVNPIAYVPYLCLFVNGRPFLQFDDQPTLDKIINFVAYSLKLIESKKSFMDKGGKLDSEIPAYSIAKGYHDFKCDDDGFCYLTYNDAYKSKAENNLQLKQANQNAFTRQ